MDSNRFDELARYAMRTWSRRTVLKAGGGAFAAFLTTSGRTEATTCRAPRKPCRRNEQCCSGRCNPRNGRCSSCGSGRRFCPEGLCILQHECCPQEKPCNGGCIPVEECCGGCPTGQTCCQSPRVGVCVDLQNDPFNCGLCSRVCPTGNHCVAGRCVA